MKTEHEIAVNLGLKRQRLTRYRRVNLKFGEDWIREDKKPFRIMWTLDAIEKFKGAVAQGAPSATPTTESTNSGSIPPAPVVAENVVRSIGPALFTITSISINPYYLDGIDTDGNKRKIRVQATSLYQLQDKLLAISDPANPTIFMAVGPRPNFKGDRNYPWRLKETIEKQ